MIAQRSQWKKLANRAKSMVIGDSSLDIIEPNVDKNINP